MILKALYDYYHRSGNLAPAGKEIKEIPFLVVINKEGEFQRIEDRRIDKKRAQSFCVIKGSRTSAIVPYLFWDNVEYILNYTKDQETKNEGENEESKKKRETSAKKSQQKNDAAQKKFKEISEKYPNDEEFRAVNLFYQKEELSKTREDPLWEDIKKKPTVNISFLLEGRTTIVAENKLLDKETSEDTKDTEKDIKETVCLISGKYGKIAETTTATMIPGSQATAKLVSFQVKSGYDSYGKEKGGNAPISVEAESAYTTALNKLLGKDSRNKFNIGSRTFVFWASAQCEKAQEAENMMFDFMSYSNTEEDDPNKKIEQVRKFFNSIYSGSLNTSTEDRFYILGLAPNAARIAVVYWEEIQLKDFASKICQHFEDMKIVDTRKNGKPYFGIHSILSAVTLKGKTSEVQPNLPEATIKSMLQGTPYPYSLFRACISRIRAEQGSDHSASVTTGRAGIIKGYLNRLKDNNKKITEMLDKKNSNQGYLCGRLFATLEYLQERSSNIHTIRERYMNAASATPAAIFPTLINLSVHHAEKLEKGGQIFFENIKGEIIAKIDAAGFPSHLNLDDQGRFMVGYYHQRQEFYTSKETKEQNEEI